MRRVPEAKIQFTAVSGVLAPVFLENPLANLWKGVRDPKMIAEVLQIITQMLFSNWVKIRPKITFGKPKSVEELKELAKRLAEQGIRPCVGVGVDLEQEVLFDSVLAESTRLLVEHISRY